MQRLLICLFCASAIAGESRLRIQPAVELRLDPAAGLGYQIQSSSDLSTWNDLGNATISQTGTLSRFVAADRGVQQYFRLEEFPVRDLSPELATIRSQFKVPALGCAVIRSNRVVGLGVVGVRKQGVAEPATRKDLWHLGSVTKSFTATLAGILVDEGKITWQTKLADVFPGEAAKMHADWKSVTLEQLLSNRSGAPEDLNPSGIWAQLWAHTGTPREQRLFLLQKLTALPPAAAPGTTYIYSNAGFSLAGAMLEQVANQAWEDLLSARVFVPLGMADGGFGVPATPRHINQPWGHTFDGTVPVPVEPGSAADNPPGIGPAATAHCSLLDFATYAAFHVAGERGQGRLLQPETFRKLHADVAGQGYALGWVVGDRPWAGGKTLSHTGSNNQWYANVWLAPNQDFAVVIVTNMGSDPALKATDAVAAKMIGLFL